MSVVPSATAGRQLPVQQSRDGQRHPEAEVDQPLDRAAADLLFHRVKADVSAAAAR